MSSVVARVDEPGPFTTIQDAGRWGYRRFGVPLSGALDVFSLSVANTLAGNSPGSPALEVIQGPISVSLLEDTRVGYSGGSVAALVDGERARNNPIRIRRESSLRLETNGGSMVTYVAIAGGLMVEKVMGSASTYARAGFGGLGGRTLQRGDLIRAPVAGSELSVARVNARLEASVPFRAVRGPHADRFPAESTDGFFRNDYRISYSSDRMGYRLEGSPLRGFRDWGRVLTFPVFPGMVQVTPDGLPIVLMADCQTTGGYPVIAMVTAPDLCALAQKPPGSSLSFREVTKEESYAITNSFFAAIGLWQAKR